MSTKPKDIAFNNASNNRDHNIFTEEYYGGADVFIYIDGVRYKNISAINFSIREMQKPIYGYSSRIYDDIATGTRIVQGVIKVPVKNDGPADILNETEGEVSAMSARSGRLNPLVENDSNSLSVPDWVYKYSPNKADLGTENEPFDLTDKHRADIARVQAELNKQDNAGLDVTGILDFKTKYAISIYKKKMNLVVNTNCDMELENRLNIHDGDTVFYTKGNVNLRYSPDDNSLASQNVPAKNRVVVQGIVDDNWYLVQIDTGRKGYIKKTEVYK